MFLIDTFLGNDGRCRDYCLHTIYHCRLIYDNCTGKIADELLPYIWRPTVFVGMAKSTTKSFLLNQAEFDFLYVKEGRMTWITDGLFKIDCGMFFDNFPFDNQNCEFWVASADGHAHAFRFSTEFSVRSYNKQKDLQFHVAISELKRPAEYGGRTIAGFHVHLRRKLYPFLMNTYFPTLVLVIISLFSFLIPVSCVPGNLKNEMQPVT